MSQITAGSVNKENMYNCQINAFVFVHTFNTPKYGKGM